MNLISIVLVSVIVQYFFQKFVKETELEDIVIRHYNTLFSFLDEPFLKQDWSSGKIYFITSYIDENRKELLKYFGFEKDDTLPKHDQRYRFLGNKYTIKFQYQIKLLTIIINDNIRPVLTCDIEFIPCNDGDVMVIFIPKMKDIPHAYVNKTKNGEIRSREYYIRIPHGKRFVSDRQLQYLFRNEELELLFPFKFTLRLYKDILRVDFDSDFDFLIEDLSGLRNYDYFFRDLENEDINKIKEYGVTEISY